MGLAGRKVKQRIGNDPRNLSWADDASRFGQAYLAKFGWDASKGLGASGEGRTNALKATQKLDMLGIGMQHQNDPDGIAWRQNRDFENVLRRLNNETTVETSGMGSFHKANEGGEVEEVVAIDESNGESTTTKKDKKREKGKKRKVVEREEEDETIDKERLEDKKKRKKRRKSRNDDGQPVSDVAHEAEASSQSALPMVVSAATPTNVVPQALPIRAPPRTHRARIIAAKRMVASNSTALAEILGIPASSSSSSSPAAFTATSPSSSLPTTTTAEAQDQLQILTTSTQSVGDYFKAKLSAKAQQQQKPTAAVQNDDVGLPRAGLGASRSLPTETTCSSEQACGGIGSSSRFAAMFALGQVAPDTTPRHDATDCDEEDRRKKDEKKRAEEKRKAKEERRRRKAEGKSITAAGSQLNGEVVDGPVDETPDGGPKRRKKHRKAEALDSRLEGAPSTEDIATKKRKKRDKDRKSGKHRELEE